MESILMISAIVLIAYLGTILYNLSYIKKQQEKTADQFLVVKSMFQDFYEREQHLNEIEQNTVKALNDICNALNKYFKTNGEFMNNSSFTLCNIAICMIPFINEIKERAVMNEDYEKAQECVNIIKNLQEVLKQTGNN